MNDCYMKEQKLLRNKKPWIDASNDHKQWLMKQERKRRSKERKPYMVYEIEKGEG